MQAKRKFLFITGSRGEYGYIRPIIREIQRRSNLDYEILVTNMHLLDEFGYSVAEIEKDGFKIGSRIYNTLDGYNRLTMIKSLGIFLQQLPETIDKINPTIIVLAGDRGEQLIGAMAGAHMYIPVAHIQAGEISANIDGTVRHAITKFSHIHFAATKGAAKRVYDMGEQRFRIFQTGAPMLDELVTGKFSSKTELEKKFNISFSKPVMLFVYHPTTEDFSRIERDTENVLDAVTEFRMQTLVIMPNSDAGTKVLKDVIFRRRKDFIQIFRNLPRHDYAGLMRNATVMVGNSSSGLIEAPCFGLPVVNIGRRQEGRECSSNVIHVPCQREKIINAIRKAQSPSFIKQSRKVTNPYGDGKSSKKIVDILSSIKIDDELLFKKLRY